jgi:hypothetical protein
MNLAGSWGLFFVVRFQRQLLTVAFNCRSCRGLIRRSVRCVSQVGLFANVEQ